MKTSIKLTFTATSLDGFIRYEDIYRGSKLIFDFWHVRGPGINRIIHHYEPMITAIQERNRIREHNETRDSA